MAPSIAMGETRAIIISDLGGGGTQRVVKELASDWLEAGHEVAVITLSSSETDQVELPPGVRRIALDCAGNSSGVLSGIVGNIRRVRSIRRAILESGADRVVSFLAATNILSILACSGLNVRLVISERNDPSRQQLGRAWEFLRRQLYRKADCITANSKQALKSLSSYVPQSKLLYVPNPLPDWPGEPSVLAEREKIVLAVGRLHRQKAYDLMLPVFASSKARVLGWRLAILGEGEERAALEALAEELEIKDIIEMPGHSSNVREWYERAGLLIMTSRYEGMPNAVLEAISRGLPVMVSETCGDASELVGQLDCGYVVDPGHTDASAEALDRLILDQELRVTLGHNGRIGIAQNLSIEAARDAWECAISERPAAQGGRIISAIN